MRDGTGDLQHTLAAPVSLRGVGIHTGVESRVYLEPGEVDAGITILPAGAGSPRRVAVELQSGDARCTSLSVDGAAVHTVEHLLSALAGCGVDNCQIRVEGPEAPILDGSARPYVEAILAAGLQEQPKRRSYVTLEEAVWIEEGESTLVALPGSKLRVTCSISFEHKALGKQIWSGIIDPQSYANEIAPARTFGFLREVEALRRRGLAMGGSLENAVVIGDEGYLNPLRFADEPVRHKALDLIGDLELLGAPLKAHVIALKPSHRVNAMLVRKIQETRRSK